MNKVLVFALVCSMLVPLFPCAEETLGVGQLKVGDVIAFGQFEQDNDPANGREPIAWRVLAVMGDKALLLNDNNLDTVSYHNQKVTPVTWETCALRAWLNEDFLETVLMSVTGASAGGGCVRPAVRRVSQRTCSPTATFMYSVNMSNSALMLCALLCGSTWTPE